MARYVDNRYWHSWQSTEVQRRRTKRQLLLTILLSTCLSAACGLTDTAVTRQAWVGFFAMAALIALMLQWIGIVRFCLAGERVRQMHFEGIHAMIRWGSLLHMLLMALSLCAGCVFCFRNGAETKDLPVLFGFAAMIACSCLIFRQYSALPPLRLEKEDA